MPSGPAADPPPGTRPRPLAVVVCVAGPLGLLATLTDAVLLSWHHQSANAHVFALTANLCMACLLALLASAAVLLGHAGYTVLRQRFRWGRMLAPAMLYGVLACLCWYVVDVLEQAHPWWYVGMVMGGAGLMWISAVAAFSSRPWVRRLVVLPMAVLGLALDANPPGGLAPALLNLMGLISTTAFVALFIPFSSAPWARRLPAWSGAVVLGIGLGSVPVWNGALSGSGLWRLDAERHARWQPRLASVFRALVDLDGDGFSSVAWGGDCDDGNAQRHPMMRDLPGHGDQNCNGVEPPAHPLPGMTGLTDALGDPVLPPGSIDLVLVLSVEALRLDGFKHPGVMPNLNALAARGILFTNLYASGTRTWRSLLLSQRGKTDGEPLGQRLSRASITSTLIMPFHLRVMSILHTGFTRVLGTSEEPWDGRTVTDTALADLREHAGHPPPAVGTLRGLT